MPLEFRTRSALCVCSGRIISSSCSPNDRLGLAIQRLLESCAFIPSTVYAHTLHSHKCTWATERLDKKRPRQRSLGVSKQKKINQGMTLECIESGDTVTLAEVDYNCFIRAECLSAPVLANQMFGRWKSVKYHKAPGRESRN